MKKEFVAVGNIYRSDIPMHCFANLKLNLGRKSEFLGSIIPDGCFMVQGERLYGTLEFNHLRFQPLFRLPVALKLTPTLLENVPLLLPFWTY